MKPTSHLILLVIVVTCKGECPVWTSYNSSTQQCECGNSLNNKILCDPDTLKVSVSQCYCMTYSEDSNTTVVGTCFITCLEYDLKHLGRSYVHQLNQKICGSLKRTGQLCGKCVDNYSYPVYSYTENCVQCSRSDFKHNLVKYVCIAFLPLTAFYFVVILYKISITSGDLVGWTLVCQIATSSLFIRTVLVSSYFQNRISRVVISFFTILNLDFFRSVYSPFCIHPEMTAMQVLALDYLVAVYPLLLIFLTYIAVSLHDRYPIVVKMWRPAYKLFRCIRREWNIRGSLVQAFASFMILSYVKSLNVSFDLLQFVYLHDVKGEVLNQTYFYSDAEIVYFGPEHLPYGVLAIAMLVIFNILPMILLLLYPCRCFQRCLNRCGVRSQLLHTLMDAFQGCYRHQPRDCRYFAGIYFCVRILVFLIVSLIKNKAFFTLIATYFILVAIIVFFSEPYKVRAYQKVDGMFILLYSICYLGFLPLKSDLNSATFLLLVILGWIIVLVVLVYGIAMIIRQVLPPKAVSFFRLCWQCITNRINALEESVSYYTIKQFDETSRLL